VVTCDTRTLSSWVRERSKINTSSQVTMVTRLGTELPVSRQREPQMPVIAAATGSVRVSAFKQYAKRKAPTSMTPGPFTTRARGNDEDSSSSNDAGLSQIDSKTACNSATACTSSDLTHATFHRLHPETRATTAPGQSGSLSGSDSNGLGSCFASAHASEPNTSNDSGSKSLGTSSSKSESGSKEEASDTGGVAVDGQEGVQGSSGGAGGESQTQPQRVDGEADGAGNSAGGGQRENEDADQDSKDKGRHDAEKAAKTQTDFVVHVEFTDDSAHEGHCQVGRSLK